MKKNTTRREFFRNASLAAGLAAASAAANRAAEPAQPTVNHQDYPRYQPGPGGPVGSATDRGKLVPGLRDPSGPPVPIVVPDSWKLTPEMEGEVKVFHLHATPTRCEFLPGAWMNVWGFNDSMPGPTLEATEGDRVRITFYNMLPEPTILHLHGLELPNRIDGVHGVTQDPIQPGEMAVYEFTLHQHGTFFYHSHGPMQEALGMAGMFIVHPRTSYQPVVDDDFALLIQEWAIMPQSTIPNGTSMEFNWFTLNGRSAPYITPLIVRLGSRVRIRLVNMSPIDHHPMHLHGHTFWITGTEAGRIPESAWIPSNNVLVGVAQARDIEFIANNPGDWVLHCHMFHHMMNHMAVMVGPMHGESRGGMNTGMNAQAGMGMTQGGPALSQENGPSLGRAMGENTGAERTVPTMPLKMEPKMQMPGGDDMHGGHDMSEGKKVPGYPADMMDMMGMYSASEIKKLTTPDTRGMRRNWFAGIEGLHTVVRVLPPELYKKVMSGRGDVPPGASVPGGSPGTLPGEHEHRQ
ncbi:MAG TPA: copper oxidase [Gemmataceae bacterium]|nr:copper oxidase [Gemmataceae bacterium]